MKPLFLLEDDSSLAEGLVYALEKNGFQLQTAASVREAKKELEHLERFALLLLDISLPDGTGFEVCDFVRKCDAQIPVIFLTASDEEISIIRGLDGGADDYITKPFKLGELCSRIRVQLRRKELREKEASVLVSGGVTVDLLGNQVQLNGKALELTGAEYRLLCLLIRHAGQVLPRNTILDRLWDGNGSFVDDNTLSVYIRRLREKLETDPSRPKHLVTVRGIGYQWKEEEA